MKQIKRNALPALAVFLALALAVAAVGFAAAPEPPLFERLSDQQKVALQVIADHEVPGQTFQTNVTYYDATGEWTLRHSGLGNLRLVKCVNDSDDSGFFGYVYEDPATGARGFSFRGMEDPKFIARATRDIIDCGGQMFAVDTAQRREALAMFEECRNKDGLNYLFGHSLGGALAAQVFAEYNEQVRSLFLTNAFPLNAQLLTEAQKQAFLSDKVEALVIDGDMVWRLGEAPWAVRFVKNNHTDDENFVGGHLLHSMAFDQAGSAIPEPAPYQEYRLQSALGLSTRWLIGFFQSLTGAIPEKTAQPIRQGYEKVQVFIDKLLNN
ncbi:MAG: alpha/beta fold hydrolase [Oscillospiraceae bacterium]|jgi:pimeloyl-ACP methyl ester carboxylesterase|nr:alpha/beta fold hydrolase [Oscillospiraceae bacterium]